MDTVIKITAGIFLVILVAFTGIVTYTLYTETAYRNSLTGTYTYTCSITTDSPLYNVTLFIPVPADISGNSPIVAAFSSHTVSGVPADWNATLFDTGKVTLLKITTPAILPPAGTSPRHPSTITFSSESRQNSAIDTRNPVEKSAVFRPVQTLTVQKCPPEISAGAGTQCASYTTSLYADYTTSPDTEVTIQESIIGRNNWTIFEPKFNEYRADVIISRKGDHKGWLIMDGILSSSAGTYDIPGSG
jgi:hypothetical protein